MTSPDWGAITPEGINSISNNVMYVFNHDLTSPEKLDRTVRFIVGRLQYYDLHLPPNPKLVVKIDVRGQSVSKKDCSFLKLAITDGYNKRNPLIIDILQ